MNDSLNCKRAELETVVEYRNPDLKIWTEVQNRTMDLSTNWI